MFITTLLLGWVGTGAGQDSAVAKPGPLKDSAAEKLVQLMDAYFAAGRFNGSVLVARKGVILLEKGYGWRDAVRRLPNDNNTVFQIASTTKTFTSTMVLRLAAEGKLSLQDRISRWYPAYPKGDSITVEQLLTHTSGIHDFTRNAEVPATADETKMMGILTSHPLDFPPGTRWDYSNSGYVLLGYIIQKVTGMTYFEAVRKMFFGPLNMSSSGFDFAHLAGNDRAVGYLQLTDSVAVPDVVTDSSVPFAAGAVCASVEDLYKWHLGLQSGKVLTASQAETAYRPVLNPHYGHGWTVDSMFGRRVVSHSGSISGFGSDFERVPADDICIVLLSNRGESTFTVQQISRKMLALLCGQPYILPRRWVIRHPPMEELRQYVGSYELKQMGLVFRVWEENGRLYGQSENRPGPRSTLLSTGDDHFIDERDNDTGCTFGRDGQGKVDRMVIEQMGMKREALKIK
jgi:CubicO group peptidase (beta-lactamase class C family)